MGIFPFIDMDVLFLIGISLPLAYLFLTLDREARWGIILALFCATPCSSSCSVTRRLPLHSPLRMLHPVKRVFSCQRLPGIGSSAAGSRSFPGLVSHFWEPARHYPLDGRYDRIFCDKTICRRGAGNAGNRDCTLGTFSRPADNPVRYVELSIPRSRGSALRPVA